jgi:hypothetical protein
LWQEQKFSIKNISLMMMMMIFHLAHQRLSIPDQLIIVYVCVCVYFGTRLDPTDRLWAVCKAKICALEKFFRQLITANGFLINFCILQR